MAIDKINHFFDLNISLWNTKRKRMKVENDKTKYIVYKSAQGIVAAPQAFRSKAEEWSA